MRAIVTVIGRDRVGIIAEVSGALARAGVNILDITQTVLQEYFTMIMLTDISGFEGAFSGLADLLGECGERLGMSVRIQREDIFEAMHRL
ncbi:MAG: ACT domain-containing protein [Oscillospiraceae bacterium]|jgi:ACT domain-containing protein|nr:ACT domain-containing protein [Oscillospiraceae bacterium]